MLKFADQIREGKDSKVEISHNILTQVMDEDRCVTYTKEQAVILAQLMVDIRESFVAYGVSFAQRYSYQESIKALGESARRGAYVEAWTPPAYHKLKLHSAPLNKESSYSSHRQRILHKTEV